MWSPCGMYCAVRLVNDVKTIILEGWSWKGSITLPGRAGNTSWAGELRCDLRTIDLAAHLSYTVNCPQSGQNILKRGEH